MLKQPVGFVKLTNVALIKYKANGKRFEIACFKNQVLNWRNGVEKNLAEVMQSEEVYLNAAQGEVANKTVLEECFPGMTRPEIMQTILDKGEMQISQIERAALMKTLTNDILYIISAKVVHPKTKRAFSVEIIQNALKELGVVFVLSKSAKKQAMDAIKALTAKFFVEKAGMLVKLVFKTPEAFLTAAKLANFEVRSKSDESAVVLVAHERFMDLEALANNQLKDELTLAVLDPNFIESEILTIDKSADSLMLPRTDPESAPGKPKKKGAKQSSTPHPQESPAPVPEKPTIANLNATTLASLVDKKDSQEKVCHTCKEAVFEDANKYRDHIKSELHKFNLQRKMKGETAMNAEEHTNFLLMQEFVSKKKGKN